MKKLFATFLLTAPLVSALADQPARAADYQLSVIRFTPCSSYMYSSEARGYVCSSPGMWSTVPDAYSLIDIIRAQNAEIEDLKARVSKLEAARPQPPSP